METGAQTKLEIVFQLFTSISEVIILAAILNFFMTLEKIFIGSKLVEDCWNGLYLHSFFIRMMRGAGGG